MANGHVVEALSYYESKNTFHWQSIRQEAMQNIVEHWYADLPFKDLSNHLILAHRNIDIQVLNLFARSRLIEKRWIAKEEQSFEGLRRVPSADGLM